MNQPKSQNKFKNEDHEQVRGSPYSDIPEWLQESRENLVDDEIPLQGGSHASSSHETSLEPTIKRSADLGKHSVETHFPKDRNCEICQRTKITRGPCRRRNGGAVLRAENFDDLITADHKIVSEGCESRNNHRYAIMVQDLATQWIQSYPCKKKTSQEIEKKASRFRDTYLTRLVNRAELGRRNAESSHRMVQRRQNFSEAQFVPCKKTCKPSTA